MALVAGLGIIAVAAFILVLIVHVTLLLLMAFQAAKGVGGAGGMTLCTRKIMITRQGKGCVINGGRGPGAGAVALFTTMRVIFRHMGWSRLIVGAVTRIAFRG